MVVLGKGGDHDNQTLERCVTRAEIHQDIDTSLNEMRLDAIDIYILHKDDPDAEVGPIVDALNEEAQAGRIKTFGGSSWSHQRLDEANRYADEHGSRRRTDPSPSLGPDLTKHEKR